MFPSILTRLFGSRNERLLKTYRKTVERINALEPSLEPLSDDDLRAKTEAFRQRVAGGETLDSLLPEAIFWPWRTMSPALTSNLDACA